MKLQSRHALLAVLFACGFSVGAQTFERFALIAGANVGGKGTTNLKYAANDAKRVRETFVGLGGVAEENAMLLLNPELESFVNGLSFIGNKIRKAARANAQTQFLLYYSGHSDERGLLLFGERLEYGELRSLLAGLGADVRVVILDSCSSGAFTREKGGSITAPFLLDESSSVEGHAYITSSTAEEASQESDRIESSFFTYSLINGLRGAADIDADGQVSLDEVYQYAYDRTLSATEKTKAGAQHPAFDFKLNGMGNLVLTDTREGDATFFFSRNLQGKISVRDISNKLVLEFNKPADKEMRIGIEHGYYKILLESGGSLSETVAIVDERKQYEIRKDGFRGVAAERNAIRGEDESVTFFPVGFSVDTDGSGPSFFFSAFGGKVSSMDGVMLGLLYNRADESSSGFQGAAFANISNGDFYGMQAAWGVNIARSDVFGVQGTFLYNEILGNLKGVQFALSNHVSGNAKFGQIGAVNSVGGDGRFFQFGGLNRSESSIRGFQGGIANIAKKVEGFQFGLVNYSEDHSGVQLGLVNISRNLNGLPIGLIDIQFNGENRVDFILQSVAAEFDDLDNNICASTYFRLGSRYFYKYFGVGLLNIDDDKFQGYPAYHVGAGLGVRLPLLFEGFAIHLDAGANYQSATAGLDLTDGNALANSVLPQFRLFASSRFFKHFGLLAGFEQWVYTKYKHEIPKKTDFFHVNTGLGLLMINSRFFLGIQI